MKTRSFTLSLLVSMQMAACVGTADDTEAARVEEVLSIPTPNLPGGILIRPVPPAAPSLVIAFPYLTRTSGPPAGAGAVRFYIQDLSTNEVGFRVMMPNLSPDGGDPIEVASNPAVSGSGGYFTLDGSGFQPGSQMEFYVVAYNSGGTRASSSQVVTIPVAAPAAPTQLSLSRSASTVSYTIPSTGFDPDHARICTRTVSTTEFGSELLAAFAVDGGVTRAAPSSTLIPSLYTACADVSARLGANTNTFNASGTAACVLVGAMTFGTVRWSAKEICYLIQGPVIPPPPRG